MKDKLFNATKCDRCNGNLSSGRTMSWFNEDTICVEKCSKEERKIRDSRPGEDLEGCGYIPSLKTN